MQPQKRPATGDAGGGPPKRPSGGLFSNATCSGSPARTPSNGASNSRAAPITASNNTGASLGRAASSSMAINNNSNGVTPTSYTTPSGGGGGSTSLFGSVIGNAGSTTSNVSTASVAPSNTSSSLFGSTIATVGTPISTSSATTVTPLFTTPTLGGSFATSTPVSAQGILPPVFPICDRKRLLLPAEAFDTMVEVTVGRTPFAKTFHIYKGLWCHYSTFFKAALNGNFSEGVSGKVTLPDDKPDVFQAVYNWINTRRLDPKEADLHVHLSYRDACEIWVFADAKGMPLVGNAAIDYLFAKASQNVYSFPYELISYVYANTMVGSSLRRFLVELALSRTSFETVKMWKSGINNDFLLDLLSAASEKNIVPFKDPSAFTTDWITSRRRTICFLYHDHSGNQTKSVSTK
ncbi:hypothetical protein BDV96DRAFT_602551 [Lophiotrema nucula]|uniref:BTB domain-containing protein n=1 Tax=Lophiotrema nucula TaxID=690887 RepID=A0A6A5YYX3_9PLEO|nr:hypothetical protein BDV96DRAFT_602551 [Lophiotrema nucula]